MIFKAKIFAGALMALAFAGGVFAEGEYRSDFDRADSVDSWEAIQPSRGSWDLDAGEQAYVHARSVDDGGHAFTVSPFRMIDGEIEIRAVATRHNAINNGGCFGIMVKYINQGNWYAVRYGGYGMVNIRAFVDGEGQTICTGYSLRPEIGRNYTAKVVLRGDRMIIMLDGEPIAAVGKLPFAGAEGYAGIYALSSARFDYFSAKKKK